VQSKHVDADAATVTVVFDPSRTSVTAVSRAITDAGFPAKAHADGG
jgi:copper chaperone CopZ